MTCLIKNFQQWTSQCLPRQPLCCWLPVLLETDPAHLAQTAPGAFRTSCPVPCGHGGPFSLRSFFHTKQLWCFLALPCVRADRSASFGRVSAICSFCPHETLENWPASTARCAQWCHCSVSPITAPSPSPYNRGVRRKKSSYSYFSISCIKQGATKPISCVTPGNSSHQEWGAQSITLAALMELQRKTWRKNVKKNVWTIKCELLRFKK